MPIMPRISPANMPQADHRIPENQWGDQWEAGEPGQCGHCGVMDAMGTTGKIVDEMDGQAGRQAEGQVKKQIEEVLPSQPFSPSASPSKEDHQTSQGIQGGHGVLRLVARILLLLVRGYQYGISPLFPPCCRYTPTCSEYAAQAILRYGAVRGAWLALRRILRCHPFTSGGYDPLK